MPCIIYILKLEHNKYYVGKTSCLSSRVLQHFTEKGSEWTKLHKPVSVIEIHEDNDIFAEEKYTLLAIDKYGIDNVRGGSITRVNLSQYDKKRILKQIHSIKDECFKCGMKGHFAKDCEEGSVTKDYAENVRRPYNRPPKRSFDIPDDSYPSSCKKDVLLSRQMVKDYIDMQHFTNSDGSLVVKPQDKWKDELLLEAVENPRFPTNFINKYGDFIVLGGNDCGEFIGQKVNEEYVVFMGKRKARSIDFECEGGWDERLIKYCETYNYKLREDHMITIYGDWYHEDADGTWCIENDPQGGMRISLGSNRGGALEHLTLVCIDRKMFIINGFYYIS